MCTFFSHSRKLGGRKSSSSGDTIGNLGGVTPYVISVVSGVCDVSDCTRYTHNNFICICG